MSDLSCKIWIKCIEPRGQLLSKNTNGHTGMCVKQPQLPCAAPPYIFCMGRLLERVCLRTVSSDSCSIGPKCRVLSRILRPAARRVLWVSRAFLCLLCARVTEFAMKSQTTSTFHHQSLPSASPRNHSQHHGQIFTCPLRRFLRGLTPFIRVREQRDKTNQDLDIRCVHQSLVPGKPRLLKDV